MKIGFVSDAHGNPHGLELCLAELKKAHAEEMYFLGDSVGYLPREMEVIRLLERERMKCIKGNHDALLLGELPVKNGAEAIYRLNDASARMSPELKDFIAAWPLTRKLHVCGKRILLVHGRPSNPLEGYLYADGPVLPDEAGPYDVVVMGHTHRPFIRREQGALWLNAGSCGLPRDIGGLASCLLYDAVTDSAEILRVPMDVDGFLVTCGTRGIAKEVVDCLHRTSTSPVLD
jgi:putative phosphoesterase